MAADRDPARLSQRIRAAAADLAGLEAAMQAGAPWPLSARFGVEPEARWGPPETLAHVAEMLPFWAGELERLLAGAAEPVPFGRVASDVLRIGVIERDRTLPPHELFERIAAGAERLAARLDAMDASGAGRRGRHPTLGDMAAAEMIERFGVAHLEEHVAQLRDTIGLPD